MGAVLVHESVIKSKDDEPEPTSAQNDIDQRNVILQSLECAISLDVNMNDLKSSPYLSSDHIDQAKAALFKIRSILQTGQSAIARKQIENSRQMTI